MKKTELITAVANKAEVKKADAQKVIEALLDVITAQLAEGDKVQLTGFGTFEVSERAAHEGRNPRNGETLSIEASKSPKFKASKTLKDKINA